MILQEDFDVAAEEAKSLPDNVTNEDKLQLYALFKQSTVGDVEGSRPGMFDQKVSACKCLILSITAFGRGTHSSLY
jgi:acyl-CoA-binding protein